MLAQDPYTKVKALPEKFEILPVGDIRPGGWLKEQIQSDLDGFTGHLDSLAPDLIVKDDIFIKDRLSRKIKSKDVGALGAEGDWQIQLLWWNSETQGNWRDGFIRSAIMAGDQKYLDLAQKYVDRILASQDEDGYLGIYDSELRYRFYNENGELWAKATLLRGLLAWYDYSKDEKVLTAVRRAVDNTMKGFPVTSHPFYSKNENVGGTSHGLTFTDVLETLYLRTKDAKYLDYALFLYKDFSTNKLNEDGQYPKLADNGYRLKGHGVHTYEQLRSLSAAAYASGNPELQKAITSFQSKIDFTTTVTGGPIGDEWIGGGFADETHRGYEYCSLQELMHSYESLYAKSGNTGYGDKIERIFFNAAQGARHPEESCIAYLKTDNSYAMTGGKNGDESDPKQTRYRYSPVHKEAAVCCVPNAGRITPYYVQYMWMKEGESTLVASLLGPSEVRTKLNGKDVRVTVTTNYPNDGNLVFSIESDTDFTLRIRRPKWNTEPYTSDVSFAEEGKFLSAEIKKGQRTFRLSFPMRTLILATGSGTQKRAHIEYGPLVLARRIEARKIVTKEFGFGNFREIEYEPLGTPTYSVSKTAFGMRQSDGVAPWSLQMIDPEGKTELVKLFPIGQTILRQVTFPFAP